MTTIPNYEERQNVSRPIIASIIFTAEKTLREHKDKIPSDLKQEAETKIQAVRSALQGTDVNAIHRARQELSDVLQKIRAAIYKQPPPPPPGEEGGEGTVEGEFREV